LKQEKKKGVGGQGYDGADSIKNVWSVINGDVVSVVLRPSDFGFLVLD